MSTENLELVRRILGLWNKSNLDPTQRQELFDPEVCLDLSRRQLNPAIYEGFDGIDRFRAEVGEVWDEFSIELEELVDAEDRVVSVMHATGQGRGSGIEIEGEIAWVWTFSEGHVTRIDGDFDREGALKAAGLKE